MIHLRSAAGCFSLAAILAALHPAAPALAQAPGSVPADAACAEGHRLAQGVCVSAGLVVDGFANLRGGIHRSAAALGQLSAALEADLGQAISPALEGWSFGLSTVGIHGRQPTPTLVGSLAPVSNAEALSTFRLNELWVERSWEGVAAIRLGQLAVDSEFAAAEAAGLLRNGTFGWPVALATSLPSGGVAYPFAAPGIRLALGDPDGATGLRLGVFAGDPGGRYGDETDPQRHNRHGTNFSFNGGTFMILEAVTGGTAKEGPRPWTAKLGLWLHARGAFADQRRDAEGLSLADPASSGEPRGHRGNHGAYGIAEATLWRSGAQSLAAFGRVFAQPADRNLVSFQADAGIAWAGPFGRAGETFSLGTSFARIGQDARGLDRDIAAFGDEDRVRRDHEWVVEASYDIPLVEGRLHLRPGLQWLVHPAAREPDERVSGRPIRDALVAGLRLEATF
ncbi:carbohydrate porin [Pseudoroseomonas rhizosphaerae]|uniref:Carbohydrate porin n=1 Tax=Teichococcus rhizosphaerae TaxID=1335062 RepID=A0A2C7A3T7_9PROT|nr:carbohydrate porin [Pseudoroseomonas rhizosphaerae]PHK93010.1 carbohydrate porin [Pseudoroseomonas rhizosphaerae]